MSNVAPFGEIFHSSPQNYGQLIEFPEFTPDIDHYDFDCWDVEEGATVPDASSITIYPKWKLTICEIILRDGGIIVARYTGEYGSEVTDTPPSLEKAGHTFGGWNPTIPSIFSDDKIECSAIWRVNYYPFVVDKKNGEDLLFKQIAFGSDVEVPPDPVYPGHTFVGWSADFPQTMPANNVIISAIWELDEIRLTFVTGTDSGTVVILTNVEEELQVPSSLVREGYELIGWDPALPNDVPPYDAEFTAIWECKTLIITFDSKGGSYIISNEIKYGKPITVPDDPVREGYTFTGWDAQIPATVPDCDLTFSAVWTINTHTVSFLNGYGGTIRSQVQDYGSSIDVPDIPSREGHTFNGWDVVPPLTVPDRDVTITATWTINSYTICFNTNGGTQVPSITADYGTALVRPADPSMIGYTFTGWSGEFPATMPATNLTLNAGWRINRYTITFDTAGGNAIDAFTADYGASVLRPANPSRTGYTFDGWDQPIPSNVPAYDLTVTAQWRINRHTITFSTGGGTEIPPITQDYDTAIAAPADPVRTGYTFSGWSSAIPARMPDSDLTITARWTVNSYAATFDPRNGSAPAVINVAYATTIDVPDVPVREGYRFTGWSPAVPASMPAYPMTFTAQWTVRQYTITFDTAGGSEISPMTRDYGTEVPAIADPTRSGYTFAGWNPAIPDTVPASDIIVRAQWTVNQYTISFLQTGDSAIPSITKDFGAAIGAVDDPIRTGYTFAGWDSAIPATMPARDVVLTARWEINQYRISFDTAGGSSVQSIVQDYDTEVSSPSAPTRTGHTFTGWSPSVPARMPASDMTITAQWRINQYTITFVSAGDSVIQSITGDYASEVAAPPQPVRTGYTFRGWDVQIPESMPANDMTITALWSINQYTIVFDTAGGTSISSITQDYGSSVIAPADPTKTGYTFTGWSSAIPQTMPASDTTVTANWRINQYTITFDTAGGSSIASVTQDYDAPVTAPSQPVRTGYTFTGWDLSIPSSMPASDMTITARWRINQYTITFYSAGGTSVSPITQDYGAAVSSPADPTRAGHTFIGWSTPVPSTMPASDITLTANWRINQYVITFDSAGGSAISAITQDYDTPVTAPSHPLRTGYTFTGWSSAIPERMPASDTTIIARWRINQYTITFDSAGGSSVPSITQDYGMPIVPASDPSRTGYTFTGWSQQIPETMPAFDTVITANWRINQYTISFVTAGGSSVSPITQDYDTQVTAPSQPIRTGYTFTGWDVPIPERMPANNPVITAQWRINQYTITFDSAGGSYVSGVTQDYDTPIVAPTDPSRTGYTFTGWSAAIPERMPASDTTITAQWRINQYTITFASAGGSSVDPITADYGSVVTAPAAPTRTGYTFTGWDVPIPQTMPARDTTVTATWTVNQYRITFDTAGGSAIQSVVQDYDTPVTAPSDPMRTGYTFTGWSAAIPERMPANDLVITAQWRINQYTITFDTAGGSSVDPITADYAFAVSAPAAPTRTGYTFTGWDVPIPQTMPARDTTVTANWRINQYTISFDTAGGSSVQSIVQDYGTPVTAPPDPTRTGHSFNGWSTPVPTSMPASDMLITANWHINQYTVSFDTAGGSEIPYQTGDYGSRVTAPDMPARSGYTFAGWSQTIPETFPALDLIITASWIIERHTIRFDTAGGSSVPSVTQDYDTIIPSVPAPSKDGHTFAGWSPQVPERMPASDITLTAQWTVNKYTISFDTGGGTEIGDMTLDYGSPIRAPAAPELTGHRFVRWSSEIPMTMPSHNIQLRAVWELLQFRITIDTDGGPAIAPIVQYYGTAVSAPEDPSKEGYTFTGWSVRIPDTMPAENISVRAIWSVNRYTITFDTAGGSEVSPITKDYGSSVAEPLPPRKEGYRFVSWSSPVPVTMPSHDTVLTAVWQIQSYTITFDTGEGSAISPIRQEYSTTITVPEDPSRTGYTFIGWNPALPGTMPSSDTTVTAQWRINQYTVTFDTAGGSEIRPITQNYSTRIVLPADPSREGHTFRSWSSAIPETMPASDVRVTALWDVNSYRIKFDTDGGDGIPSVTYRYGEPTVRPADPVRTGYTFRGWNTQFPETMGAADVELKARWEINVHTVTFTDRGSEYSYRLEYGSTITVPAVENYGHTLTWDPVPAEIVPDDDLTYEAVWTPNVHTLRFMDGEKQVSSYTAAYGSEVRYPELNKTGYTASWDSDVNTVPDADMTLRALWTINSHLATFITGGDTLENRVEYGARLYAPDPGEREGFYFDSWSIAVPETMPDNDLFVEAVWKPTVKAGTGADAGRFIASAGNTVTVSLNDLKGYDRATVGIDGYWSVSVDPKDFGQNGNVAVSMSPASKSVMGSVSDRAVAVFSFIVTDADGRVERTDSEMTVSMPFSVPDGKEPIVWVMSGGDPVEADSEYREEVLTFRTDTATYWAAGYVDAEEDGFPMPVITAIAGVGILAAAGASLAVVRRMRS